jgi:Na+/H+ antiporter NhaD/arsenite permease-like protein
MIDWSRVPRRTPVFLFIAFLAVSALLCPSAAAQAEEHGAAETHAPAVTEHADEAGSHAEAGGHGEAHFAPSILWVLPFAALLLCIAILPLIHRTEHWWEKNSSKLLIALILATITSLYYLFRGVGFHSDPGIAALLAVYNHAVVLDYVPFIVLLFSLYTISGGINLRGDLPAHPRTNTIILGIGALIASFIGTTGAAMLLIRPLLQINHQRRHVKHTVIFFIFLVANIGGSLLPIGDPPLFLGYLRDVPFLWTFHLTLQWLFCVVVLLIVYFVWDTLAYRSETKVDIAHDETERERLRLTGLVNLPLLLGVVLAVALLVPGKQIFGFTIPMFLREGVQLGLAGLSWIVTPMAIRRANSFNFVAIGEVACLFIGIFITMMPAIEILNARGAELGLTQPWHFFWATGALSSFLDNAPTYVVFFETAGSLPLDPGMATLSVKSATGIIGVPLLVAISCGAVFMGANTYIGNGPNFMVKSIAEQSGVKMPSFFGYMLYSVAVLIPLFIVVTLVFFRG